MKTSHPRQFFHGRLLPGLIAFVVIAITVAAVATFQQWSPVVFKLVKLPPTAGLKPTETEHEDHDHGHGHGAEGLNSLTLSMQARQNLGLNARTVRPVELSTYQRIISVPAVIAERPGRTTIQVSTPLTGVIQHVHAVTGEAIAPNSLLFQIRLTHEDLVVTQSEFLQMLGELDVEVREIKRLEAIAESGAIAGKTLLERQYARDKLLAQLAAKREALKLHGLSERQVHEIEETRHLLRELQIMAPSPDEHGADEEEELHLTADPPRVSLTGLQADQTSLSPPAAVNPSQTPLVIEKLFAHKGQSVFAGETLCTLADYHRLYIEGKAFEQDASAIGRAAQNGWPMTAIFDDGQDRREIHDLKLSYVANSVDPQSRTLSFFVDLPNEIIRDDVNSENQRFISWKYRIGHRLQLQVPVEEWPDELVVPVDAVAREGVESYVFIRKAGNFERVPVHVKHRDQRYVVIAKDGLLKPGTVMAWRSAHQMLIALKNQSGGGIDPHAGHNH